MFDEDFDEDVEELEDCCPVLGSVPAGLGSVALAVRPLVCNANSVLVLHVK